MYANADWQVALVWPRCGLMQSPTFSYVALGQNCLMSPLERKGSSARPGSGHLPSDYNAIGAVASDLVYSATAIETGCLTIMDGIAALRGPIDVGCAKRRPRLVKRGYRLSVVTVMPVHRFTSDCVSCEANRDSHRRDKVLDHGANG
jgi:hypothetical protein